MRGDADRPEPEADLATMLAEMDTRLQLLQQELESVALPIARRPAEHRRPARSAAEPIESAPEPEAPAAAAAAPITPADILGRRRAATPAAEPPEPQHATPPELDDLAAPAAAPRRPPRRVQAAGRKAAAAADAALDGAAPAARDALDGAASAARTAPDSGAPAVRTGRTTVRTAAPAASATRTAAPATRTARTPAPGPGGSATPEAVVRHTILEAEDEARRVVEDARQRIAEIGARTRALLEHSLAEPAPAPQPATGRRRHRSRSVKAARRSFEGTVVVEAGPFADVAQLSAFEDVLGAVPNVADVYIRTFEHNRAHFELSVVAPTPLIVELQARSAETLNVVASGDSDLKLDIVRDGA